MEATQNISVPESIRDLVMSIRDEFAKMKPLLISDEDDFAEALARILYHSRNANDLTILESVSEHITDLVISELDMWVQHSPNNEERCEAAMLIENIEQFKRSRGQKVLERPAWAPVEAAS